MSSSNINISKDSTTKRKRRRLKKQIREAIITLIVGTIGAIVLNALIIGAAIQETDKLETMAVQEADR